MRDVEVSVAGVEVGAWGVEDNGQQAEDDGQLARSVEVSGRRVWRLVGGRCGGWHVAGGEQWGA